MPTYAFRSSCGDRDSEGQRQRSGVSGACPGAGKTTLRGSPADTGPATRARPPSRFTPPCRKVRALLPVRDESNQGIAVQHGLHFVLSSARQLLDFSR